MKQIKLLALCLAAALLAACAGNPGVSGSAPLSGESASSVQPAASGTDVAQREEGDFYDLVFDTTQDAGRLTVRYLSLQAMYGSGNTAVTTGDSAVYTSPDGLVMLVDCGNVLGGEEVTEQLRAMGVEKIDIFVLSHPHADHVGGFCTVADHFPIGQVYTNGHEYDSGTYRSMMDKIDALGISWETLAAGDAFSFGEEVQVQVYSPFEGDMDEVAGGYLDANDGSIAMRLTYGQSSFWTSGDLYIPGEQLLAQTYGGEVQSGVAKMNHHGKDTSNGREFVQAVSPKIAVGMFDSVGSRTVAMRYVANGAQVFYNCVDGAVRISTAGDGAYDVQTQKLRDISILPEPSEDGHYVVS